MTCVYLLWHARSDDEYGENAKLVGVYSSEMQANGAIERKNDQPGFRDYPAGFQISKYELDRDAWSEGFGVDNA